MTNSADPDQLASSEAIWSESTLFAKTGHVVFSKRRVKRMTTFLLSCLLSCTGIPFWKSISHKREEITPLGSRIFIFLCRREAKITLTELPPRKVYSIALDFIFIKLLLCDKLICLNKEAYSLHVQESLCSMEMLLNESKEKLVLTYFWLNKLSTHYILEESNSILGMSGYLYQI